LGELVLRVAVTTAMTPLPIVVLFIPKIRHVREPAEGLHDTDLAALVATGPIATLTLVKSAALYTNLNCKLAGCPPVAVPERARFNATVEPASADPESKTKAVLWQNELDGRIKFRAAMAAAHERSRFLEIYRGIVDTTFGP
jgi:hypothetical protein